MRDDRERLRDIDEAIEKIEKYVSIGYRALINSDPVRHTCSGIAPLVAAACGPGVGASLIAWKALGQWARDQLGLGSVLPVSGRGSFPGQH